MATTATVKMLPLRALLAHAARCARRVQPLYAVPPDHEGAERGAAAIQTAIGLAEDVAAGRNVDPVLIAQAGEGAVRALMVASEVGAAGQAAAFVANAAYALIDATVATLEALHAEDPQEPAGRALDAAATVADSAISADERVHDAARRDWDALHGLNPGRYPEPGQPVDASEKGPLGPLFPDGPSPPPPEKRKPAAAPSERREPQRGEEKPAASVEERRLAAGETGKPKPSEKSPRATEQSARPAEPADLRSERERLESERAALRAERAIFQSEVKAFSLERDEFVEVQNELDSERAALNAERAALDKQRRAVEQERAALNDERTALEAQRETLTALEEERSTHRNEREALEAERGQLNAERQRLEAQCEELRSREADLAALEARLEAECERFESLRQSETEHGGLAGLRAAQHGSRVAAQVGSSVAGTATVTAPAISPSRHERPSRRAEGPARRPAVQTTPPRTAASASAFGDESRESVAERSEERLSPRRRGIAVLGGLLAKWPFRSRTKESVRDEPPAPIAPLRFYVQPGMATAADLQELFTELSQLDRALGGGGLTFEAAVCRVPRQSRGRASADAIPDRAFVEVQVRPRSAAGAGSEAASAEWDQLRSCLRMSMRLDAGLCEAFAEGERAPAGHPGRRVVCDAIARAEAAVPGGQNSDDGLRIDSTHRHLQQLDQMLRTLERQHLSGIELAPDAPVEPPVEPETIRKPERPRGKRRRRALLLLALSAVAGTAAYCWPVFEQLLGLAAAGSP